MAAYLNEPVSDSIATLQFLAICFLDHQMVGGLMKLIRGFGFGFFLWLPSFSKTFVFYFK